MSDIVERLREHRMTTDWQVAVREAHDAADEITRLRAEVERLRGAKCGCGCRCEVADEITRAELNLSDPVGALDRGLSPAEAAVAHVWGERCSDFEPECLCCRAWAEFDQIATLRADNERLRAALEDVGDMLIQAAQDDCENGVKWLNERAAQRYLAVYPETAKAIGAAVSLIRVALSPTAEQEEA